MQPIPPRPSFSARNLSAIGAEATVPSASSLKSAKAEEADFYAADKKKQGHKRDQRSRNVVNIGMLLLLGLVAVCVAIGIISWAAHRVLPTKWGWLDKAQLDYLTEAGKYLVSTAIGAMGGKFLLRNVEPE